MAMGCATCHEVVITKAKDKKSEDVTRIKLVKATATAQCLSCHEDIKGRPGESRVHAPVQRKCVTCHAAHSSQNKNQLLKPAQGGKDENLCYKCHTEGMRVPKGGSRHAALDMGCGTCHVTHKTGARDKRENQFHLTKDSPALCLDCHDIGDTKLVQTHQGQPLEKADCLTCHDPHQSSKPKLAQKFRHQPFSGGQCNVCHEAPKDGKVVLTNSDTRALCVTCHQEQATKIAKAKYQHAGAQGECTVCHSPHASKYDRLMRPDPDKVCEACHSRQAEMHENKAVLHAAAFRDGCFTCHGGHGGDNPRLLHAEGNKLCLECHSPNRKPKKVEGTNLVSIFGGAVRLPSYYFANMPALDLHAGDVMGHPIGNHPVMATIDRSDPAKRRSMGCQSCHYAHAGSADFMLVTDSRSSMSLCNRCHLSEVAPPPPDAVTNAPVRKAKH